MSQSLFDDQGDPLGDALLQLIVDYGYDTVLYKLRYLAPVVEAPSAPARPSDPETSHQAAKAEVDVGRFTSRSKKYGMLQNYARRDMTDQEAALSVLDAATPLATINGTRRRVSELRVANFIMDTGRRRKSPGSDDESMVCAITDAGHRALASLDETGWSK